MESKIIQNFDQLATDPLREHGLLILEAGLQAVKTKSVLSAQIKREGSILHLGAESADLGLFDRVFLVAFGKCAVAMAGALEPLLLDKLTAGIALDVVPGQFQKMKSLVGTHPKPSEANVKATEEILALLANLTERDLVILAISGGGSALLCSRGEWEVNKSDEIFSLLTEKGATIEEINTLRKHLSRVKGGQLAQALFPAQVFSLIFSDVPGNNLSSVASGPTVPDTTTIVSAQSVIAKYGAFDLLTAPGFELVETPKDGKYFEKVKNILLLTNEAGLSAMKVKAEELGYLAFIEDESLQGLADEAGKKMATANVPAKTCWLYGGETTVAIKGNGQGGRCQELALSALPLMPENMLILAVASDGRDNTEVAGAIADRNLFNAVIPAQAGILDSAEIEKIINNYLATNDSFYFFQKYGGQIMTGRTGANVSDFYIIIRQ